MVYARKLVAAPVSSVTWLWVEDILVSSLIDYALRRNSLFEAAQQYLHASQYQIQTERPVSDPLFRNMASWRLTVSIMRARKAHDLDAEMFDSMLSNLSSLRGDAQICRIYYPTNPNAQDLVAFLNNPQRSTTFISRHVNSNNASKRKASLFALLDAAELSLVQDRSADAVFLLNFVKQRCLVPPSVTQTNTSPTQLVTQIDDLREGIASRLENLSSRSSQSMAVSFG